MSTKKKENPALIETQHNGVTMILEKKSNGNKAPTPEMQARMEAGKVEIMKVDHRLRRGRSRCLGGPAGHSPAGAGRDEGARPADDGGQGPG